MTTIKPIKPKAPSTKRVANVPNIPNKSASKPTFPKSTVMRKSGRGR
jgi:hypothetical protein